MLEGILTEKGLNRKIKISIKTAVSFLLVALAVGLPQIVHLVAGASGGMRWLPMYLPVLLGGCILGTWWGLGIGALSPVVSFAITALAGDPMPAAARLPFMIAELTVFAAVAGLFSKKICANKWLAFPAVLLAQAAGRTAFILLIAVFQSVTPFGVGMIWAQIQQGFIGLLLQAVTVPLLVMGLAALLERERKGE